MKKLLFLIPVLLLLASCQRYGDKITQHITSNQGHFHPVTDSAGKITGTVLVFDSLYVVQPSKVQRYALAKKNGQLTWCYIFLGLAIASGAFGIVYLSGGGKPAIGLSSFALAIFLLCFAASSIDWAVTKEAEIPKVTYDSLMKADGNLKVFWDQNLYK
jgi:hypothetical protein